jgi:hypothetical protein
LIKPDNDNNDFIKRSSIFNKHYPKLRYEAHPPNLLDEPQQPHVGDINSTKTRYSQLTKDKKEDFK